MTAIKANSPPAVRLRWHSRGAMLAWLCVLPLIGSMFYAQSAWPMAVYRLVVDGGVGLLWIVAATGLGMFICRAIRLRDGLTPVSLRLASSAAAGLGLLSLIVLGLGLAGILNYATAWGLIVFGWAAGVTFARAWHRESGAGKLETWLTESAGWEWLALLATPFLALALTTAMLPPGMLWTPEEPHGYDVVEYHLQVPREWYEGHRIVPLHHNVFSYFPFNVEMHYLLAMHLHGGPWAGMYLCQMMHLAFMVLMVIAVYGLARRRTGTAGAIIAAMSLLTVPWLTQLAGIAYDEGGFLFFAILSIGWALDAMSDRGGSAIVSDAATFDKRGRQGGHCGSASSQLPTVGGHFNRFAFAGAMAGFAAGSKLTAVPEVLVAVPLVCGGMTIWKLIARSGRGRSPWLGIVVFCLLGVVSFSPWLIRNIRWAGNPVFPELMQLIGEGDFSAVQVQRWELAHQPAPDQRPVVARVKTLWRQVMSGWQFGYLLLPMGLVAFARSTRRPMAGGLFGLLMILTIVWLLFTHLQGRFFILAAPVTALLVAQMDWSPTPLIGVAPVVLFAAIGWMQINSRLCLKLYGSTGETGIIRALGIDDLNWMLKVEPLDRIPPDAPLCLVGDAKAFLYPLPMSQLRYRTVFDVRNDDRDMVEAWVGTKGRRPGELLLIDPEELKRLGKTYYGLPPLPDQVKASDRRYIVPAR